MKLACYGKTDVGRRRERNEDSYLVDADIGFFIVADGMGGHLGGDFASNMAVKTCQEMMTGSVTMDPELLADFPVPKGPADHLRRSIRVASRRIFREAGRVPNLRGMGTTVVAFLVKEGKGYIANVGDSRAYLVRDAKIQQLTVDHSLVREQLQAGFIGREDLKDHRLRNIITRSVGFQDDVESDLVERDLQVGDRYLLCTDGLTNMLSDDEILRVVTQDRGPNPRGVCEKLIEQANLKGGDDNITVILLSILKA